MIREVVATAQVHGGTRVLILTGHPAPANPLHYIIELTAYDSNHREPHPVKAIYTGSDFEELAERGRTVGRATLQPSANPTEDCDCWTRWDPHCGQAGCWGIDRPASATD